MKRRTEGTTLEHYMEFLENPHGHDLTVACLNQIIHMHGFKKIHKKPKAVLLDTLNSMDLVYPCRSTLQQSIASASLTKDDVRCDLDTLNWKECPVQSIQAIDSILPHRNNEYNTWGNGNQTSTGHGVSIAKGVAKEEPKKQRGRPRGRPRGEVEKQRRGELKKRSLAELCYAAPAPSTASTVGSVVSSHWLLG